MILCNINMDDLSREEFINLILLIILSFKLNYKSFDDKEKDFITDFIDGKHIEWDNNI